MVRLSVLLSAGLAAFVTGNLFAQTIPEFARRKPTSPVKLAPLVDIRPMSIEELSRGATVVLDATLSQSRSYLSPDEEYILSDFEMIPHRVLAGQVPALSQTTPGRSAPLILSVTGGALTIDGFTVSVESVNLEQPRQGGRYLLFLRPFGGVPGRHALFNGGGFEINGQQLKPLVRRAENGHKDIAALPFNEAVGRIAHAGVGKP